MSSSVQSLPANIRYPFWFGGSAACMATCVTHPLELVKVDDYFQHLYFEADLHMVHLQTSMPGLPRTMRGTFLQIIRTENGFRTLYNGISASLLRQLTYSTVRFGIYEEMKQRAGPKPSFALLGAMAASSGFIGGLAGNFADVVNVRMQHDAALPAHQQRKYKHAIDGMICMAKNEGFRSWFKAWLPNSSRAAVTTVGQLACYDVVKRFLMAHTPMVEDTISTQLMASFVAGLTASTMASPIDVIKTKIMSSQGSHVGMIEIVRQLTRTEGAAWLFKGWVPSFLRQGP